MERLTSAKHYNLLGQFVRYEENEVLWIRTLVLRSRVRSQPSLGCSW